MNIYEQYVDVQKKIDDLELVKKGIRDQIALELPEEGVKTDLITAPWVKAKKWLYPESVVALEKEVQDKVKPIKEKFEAEIKPFVESVETAKKLAEESGSATCEETKSLRLTPKK